MPAIDPIVDGDTGFVGVNMRLDPGQLPPGFVASARNKRFVNGTAQTRPGIKKMPWSNKAHAAWDNTETYNENDIVSYSGLAALVSGTESQVDSGGGTLTLQYAAPPDVRDGDFQDAASSHWNFDDGWSRELLQVSVNGIFSAGDYSTTGMTVSAIEAAIPSGTVITFSNGAVFTTSADAASEATTLFGSLTVDDLIGTYTGDYGGRSADHTTASASAENLWQDIDAILGCKYTVTYTVSHWTAGNIQAYISGSSPGTEHTHPGGAAAQTYSDEIVSRGQSPARLYIQAKAGFKGRVDDVSVVAAALPGQVDILGKFDQGGGVWKASGPVSNNSSDPDDPGTGIIGPYFKSETGTGNTGKTPIQAYVPAGPAPATSTIQSSYWTNLGHRVYGYGTVYGCGVFRDPLSVEHLLVATSDGVYATKEANPSVLLSGITSITNDVTFVQCFNVVVMFRGEGEEPYVMARIDEGFKAISQVASDTDLDENDSDGTESIPNASTGLFFANRLLIPHSDDQVAVSDFLNYTRYQPIMSNFRINQGSEDELVGLRRINNSTIACFKTNSVYIVSNIYGNLTDIVLDEVTREYGAVSDKSIVQVGSDVLFLSSKRGVCSLTVATNGKVSAVDQPVSEAIQPLVDRINWNHSSKAVAAYHNNRYYLAVPLDGSTYNNAILIYDTLNKAWAGYDDGDAVKVKDFVETKHQGKRRLFFLSTDGFVNLYDDDITECGFVDEIPSSTTITDSDFGQVTVKDIKDELVTRGYTAGDVSPKKWRSAEVHLSTNDPWFQVKTQYDGPEEDDQELTAAATIDANGYITAGGKTFSRSAYDRPFDKTAFVESMTNNDFFTQHRQDYSVDPDTEIVLGSNGFDPDIHQKSVNRYRYRGNSRYVQLKVSNTRGRCEVVGAKVGAVPGQNLTTKLV